VKRVTGIEIDHRAVADARYNAEIQGVKNVEFIEGDVDNAIAGIERADIVIIDPPRKGCSPQTIAQIVRLNPQLIIYASCNPATLTRDLVLLQGLGYNCQQVEPLDMFPQTAHIEVVVRVVREK
jgi:23S rRNA (uracil1939-C5)-methyltransferase